MSQTDTNPAATVPPVIRTSQYGDEIRLDARGMAYAISDYTGPFYVTPCCDAAVTYHDVFLCCKACWNEVDPMLDTEPVMFGGDARPSKPNPTRVVIR